MLGGSWSVIHPEEHLFYFTVSSLSRLLRRTGCEPWAVQTTGWNYYETFMRVRKHPAAKSSRAALQATREDVERRSALRLLKGGINSALSMMRLGDTRNVFARRLHEPPAQP